MQNLSSDVDIIAEDMGDMILSQAFDISINDLERPQDAVECVRQCLAELQAIISEDQKFACEDTDLSDQEHLDDNGEGRKTNSRHQAPSAGKATSKKRSLKPHNQEGDVPNEEESDSGREGSDRSGSRATSNYGPKRTKYNKKISCPFRKRNPTRFNVRAHRACATTYYSTISLVK